MASTTHTYDATKTLSKNTFTRVGYSFDGWATSAAGAKVYNDEQNVSNLTQTNGGTVTLYAHWIGVSYSIKYNANGGTGTMANSSHIYGTAKALSANTFIRPGYKFEGWATSASGAKVYNDKQSVSNLTTTANSTVNLYAHWTPITYSVKYNANNGTGTMANSSHTYGTAKALTANTFKRTGYTFDGWATSAGGAKVYNDKQSVSNLTTTNGATVNLYAKWKASQTKWTFNYTGNSQEFTVPATGNYKVKLYGASGGNALNGAKGGKGGYIEGTVKFNEGDIIYVYVGGKGGNGSCYDYKNCDVLNEGGWNGGGENSMAAGGGGGATDIRTATPKYGNYSASYETRIMVAGGGGGAGGGKNYGGKILNDPAGGGAGGNEIGESGQLKSGVEKVFISYGGSQTGGGHQGGCTSNFDKSGGFGKGGNGCFYTAGYNPANFACSGAGGGGWYGGGAGGLRGLDFVGGGSGGSSYYDKSKVSNVTWKRGQRTGNGYAEIEYIK